MIVINIAVVENEDKSILQIKEVLEIWKQKDYLEYKILIEVFKTGEAFLRADKNNYHVIFLDIELEKNMNGFSVAQTIRQEGCNVPIVFITGHSQYVFAGYRVDALDYIMKPVEYKKIDWCMSKIFIKLSQGNFINETKDELTQIPYDQILYFQSSLHYVDIFTQKKGARIKSSFIKLKETLPSQFVQCHRTLIVNVMKIDRINKKELTLIGDIVLPISNTYSNGIRDSYVKQNFSGEI